MSIKHLIHRGSLLMAGLLLALVLSPVGQVGAQNQVGGLAVAGPAWAAYQGAAVNTAAGSEHGVVAHLSLAEKMDVLARNTGGTWLYVLFRTNSLGWINVEAVWTDVNIPALPVVDDLKAPVGENLSSEVLAQAGLYATTAPPATPLTAQGTATVSAQALNVRSGPNTGFPSLGVVYQGTALTVLGRSAAPNIWLHVRTPGGLSGWVAGGEVETAGPLRVLPIVSAPFGDVYGMAVVTAAALNVRSGPDWAYLPLGVVYQGQTVSVMGRSSSSNWLRVRLPSGMEGWIASGEVEMDVPFSKLPVIASDEDVFG